MRCRRISTLESPTAKAEHRPATIKTASSVPLNMVLKPPPKAIFGGNNLFPAISSPRRKKQLIDERKQDAFTAVEREPGAGTGVLGCELRVARGQWPP